jgi:hypothetical protein
MRSPKNPSQQSRSDQGENQMHNLLNDAPEVINRVFDILELIVVRLTLLVLASVGAYALLRKAHRGKKRSTHSSSSLS